MSGRRIALISAALVLILVAAASIVLSRMIDGDQKQAERDVRQRGFVASEKITNSLLTALIPAKFKQFPYSDYESNFDRGEAQVIEHQHVVRKDPAHQLLMTRFALGLYHDINAQHDSAIITVKVARGGGTSSPQTKELAAGKPTSVEEAIDLAKRQYRQIASVHSDDAHTYVTFETEKGLYTQKQLEEISKQVLDSLVINQSELTKLFAEMDQFNKQAKEREVAASEILDKRYGIKRASGADTFWYASEQDSLVRVRNGQVSIWAKLEHRASQTPSDEAQRYSMDQKRWEQLIKIPEEARRPILLLTYRTAKGELVICEVRETTQEAAFTQFLPPAYKALILAQTPANEIVLWREANLPPRSSMDAKQLQTWLKDVDNLKDAAKRQNLPVTTR